LFFPHRYVITDDKHYEMITFSVAVQQAGIDQSYSDKATGWPTGVRFSARAGIFSPRRPIKAGFLRGLTGGGMKLIT
jgi:hypothetical protein